MKATDFNKAMGAVIRKHRKAHGMTMDKLAQRLGSSYQQIGKYEHGENSCSAELLSRIAATLGMSVAQLYEEAQGNGVQKALDPAESDAFLVARYIARIPDSTERRHLVEYVRKRAYQGVAA